MESSDLVDKFSRTSLVDGQVFDDKTLVNTVNAAKYGRYKYVKSTINEPTAQSVSGGEMNTAQLQKQWWNPAESYFEFQIGITGTNGATNFYWMHHFFAFIRSILMDCGTAQPVNINNFHHYMKIVAPRLTAYKQFKRNDLVSQFAPCRSLPSSNKLPASGNDCAIPYEDFKYASMVANSDTASTVCVRLYGKDIPGCFLSDNRSHKLGPNPAKLEVTYESLNKWVYKGTSATNPLTGATAYTGTNPTITMAFYQACEQDPNIIRELDAEYKQSGGRRCLIEYAENSLPAFAFTTSVNQQKGFSIAAGRFASITDIMYSIFAGTETNASALDNDTYAQSKLAQYYTNYNGVQEQPGTLNVGYITSAGAYAGFDDYSFLQNWNKDSCIQNIQQHYNNWTHWSCYREPSKMDALPSYNILQGRSPANQSIDFAMVATMGNGSTGVASNHWAFSIGQVFLIYDDNGVYIDNGSKATVKQVAEIIL
jgi:hypothetical protein